MPSFAGEFRVPRAPGEVYLFLADPSCLVKCIPELKRHEIQDREHFTATLSVGLGRVKGLITVKLAVVDKKDGSHVRILGKGSMLNSKVDVDGSFTMCEDAAGATRVRWTGNAKIGAYLMSIAGGLLDKLVEENACRFVQAVQTEMGSAGGAVS